MAKAPLEPPPEMADEAATIVVNAAFLATDAATRNPEYPGYEAVRDLYLEHLRLKQLYNDVASMVETLKNELADIRRGAVSNG